MPRASPSTDRSLRQGAWSALRPRLWVVFWLLAPLGAALFLAQGSPPALKASLAQPRTGGAQAGPSGSPQRRALLVGIARYSAALKGPSRPAPPGFKRRVDDLKAPLNDLESLKGVLETLFLFQVHTLRDQEATRAAILESIQRLLINEANPEDQVVFYFSGHGSTVRNRAAAGGQDSTIVPADALLGVRDIRSKELARLFRRAADKQVHVTVLFDSCHSGSITRGYPEQSQTRLAEPFPGAEEDDPGPGAAAERGVLTLAAARHDQAAIESSIESNGVLRPGGVFTRALVAALRTLPPAASAQRVFEHTRALMQIASTTGQEPILEGDEQGRRTRALFGPSRDEADALLVPVRAAQPAANTVQLQGGFAIGLTRSTELRIAGKESSDAPTVRITQVTGPSQSLAAIVRGSAADFPSGTLLQVVRWLPPDEPNLVVRTGPPGPPLAELLRVNQALLPLHKSARLRWLTDPTQAPSFHLLRWSGQEWVLQRPGSPALIGLGAVPGAASVLRSLLLPPSGRPALFVDFPAPAELGPQLELGSTSKNTAIALAREGEAADYRLIGSADQTGLGYRWLRPNQDGSTPSRLPVLTERVPISGSGVEAAQAGRHLTELALRLGRLRAWLKLAPPAQARFPFHLSLVRRGEAPKKAVPPRTEPIREDFTEVHQGERFAAVLQLDPEIARRADGSTWYVYLFLIDSTGESRLLFPYREFCSNDQAVFKWSPGDAKPSYELNDGRYVVEVAPPAAVDTYVLLASATSIPDPCILESVAVNGKKRERPRDPLAELFSELGSGAHSRSENTVPLTWTLQRLSVVTKPADGAGPKKEPR